MCGNLKERMFIFMLKRNNLVFVILLIVISLTLVGCNGKKIAAKVNGEEVSLEEFEEVYKAGVESYKSQYGEEVLEQVIGQKDETVDDMIRENTIESLVLLKLIEQDSKKRDIKVSEEDVNNTFKELRDSMGSKEDFKKMLEQNKVTEGEVKKNIRLQKLNELHMESVKKDLNIDNKKINEYFKKNKEQLEKVKASHILVETKEEAEEILKDIKDNNEDFEKIAKDKSIDTVSAEVGGDLGYFGRGTMVPEFEKAAFSLDEGEISDVVKAETGYHIIKVYEKLNTVEKLKDEIEEQILQESYFEYLKELKEDSDIKIFEENIQSIEIEQNNKESEDIEENKDNIEKDKKENKNNNKEKKKSDVK